MKDRVAIVIAAVVAVADAEMVAAEDDHNHVNKDKRNNKEK
jgi:hypothetical protein